MTNQTPPRAGGQPHTPSHKRQICRFGPRACLSQHGVDLAAVVGLVVEEVGDQQPFGFGDVTAGGTGVGRGLTLLRFLWLRSGPMAHGATQAARLNGASRR